MPTNAAAKLRGVPRTTIIFRMSPAFTKKSLGPPTILTPAEEDILVKWIIDNTRKGFPNTALDLCLSVKEFLDDCALKKILRENPFNDNYPGRGWVRAFMKRHPEISNRKSEAVTQASACITEKDIRGWFSSIEDVLKQEEMFEVLRCPERVFNGDETSFMLCPQKNLVLAAKGDKNVYNVNVGDTKAAVTVMFSFSATGEIVPPMIIYPYQRIPAEVVRDVPKNWHIGRSESGWMTAEVFYEYIGNTFNTFITQKKIKRPVILFVDGHQTHLTKQVSSLCSDLQIILISLYPNATRIIQPADVSFFLPLKAEWKQEVNVWRKTNPFEFITKKHVAPLLDKILKRKNFSNTLVNGFRASGLYPWNANAIDYSKCLGKKEERTENSKEQINKDYEKPIKNLFFQRFCEIIGNERVKIFQAMQANHEQAKENVLYQIWREFDVLIDGVDTTLVTNKIIDSDPIPIAILETAEPSTSSVKNHLYWPEPSKRKGCRQVERKPFVISSQDYQNILNEKETKKTENLAKKEERKRKREKNKRQKEENKRQKEENKRMQEEQHQKAKAMKSRSQKKEIKINLIDLKFIR